MQVGLLLDDFGRASRQYEQQNNIEPGLLYAVRLYSILGIGITLGFYLSDYWRVQHDPTLLFSMLCCVLQVIYLYTSWFQRKLGNAYLPLFFVFATSQLLLSARLSQTIWQTEALVSLPGDIMSTYLMLLLSPPLFILAIFISWQYDMRAAWLYTGVISLPELVFRVDMAANLGQDPDIIVMAVFLRASTYITVAYFVTRLMNQQRRLRAELSTANRQISNFATMMESLTISRERNRMARELHDTLAHTLTASSVQLQAATALWDTDPERARNLVELSLSINRDSLDETRRALQDLRASPLENLGLLQAIRDLGETTAKRAGSAVHMDLPEQVTQIPEPAEQLIYRVVQEALENVVRHAQASSVQVSLSCVADQLSLLIADDGQGFEPDGVDSSRHFGIQGMRERVRAFGGMLELQSWPGIGTEVHLTMQV